MLTGLNAFPLTPLNDDALDQRAFVVLLDRLVRAGVDAITVLGSTGSGAYLTEAERERVLDLAASACSGVPLHVGVSALRESQVLRNVRAAERAGAAAVLLAPMSYQPLRVGEVFELYRSVCESTDLPVVVYDNPTTTRFTFDHALYERIAGLRGIASIKIPPLAAGVDAAAHVASVRAVLPPGVSLGISGDGSAAQALAAGCDAWYSVIGGLLPGPALALTRAALRGDTQTATAVSDALAGLWDLFARHGSLRVLAALAAHLGLVARECLPRPVRGLDAAERAEVVDWALGAAAEFGAHVATGPNDLDR
ncbi:dihydrodipicolinate synthase family protein [Micrococcales bacterium 31B]|nr:dihydrodipicolinate synthase family protein [Micrococcales bacterium 31B]